MHKLTSPCRLHVILASKADTAIVFRRGPSAWWHILKWDLKALSLESGAWLKGTLYPARAAVSPDGRVLAYFARHGSWDTYFALSKAPWLTALCAWKTIGTWTTGAYFEPNGKLRAFGAFESKPPFHGKNPYACEFGGVDVNWNRAKDFQWLANGWVPKASGVPVTAFNPAPQDVTELVKPSPKHDRVQLSRYADMDGSIYALTRAGQPEMPLTLASWADFDHQGRLIVATTGGALEVYDLNGTNPAPLFSHDLNPLQPNPVKAPAWAAAW